MAASWTCLQEPVRLNGPDESDKRDDDGLKVSKHMGTSCFQGMTVASGW